MKHQKIRSTVAIFEDSIRKNEKFKTEEMERQKKYELNRISMRERMKKIKELLEKKKNEKKTDEEFFEENKEFFVELEVKDYSELEKLVKDYDKGNLEDEKEGYKNNLKIGHINDDLNYKGEIKKFNNLNIEQNSKKNNILIAKTPNTFEILQKINNENEYDYIPNLKEYFKKKIKEYKIINLNEEYIPSSKKSKFNDESELIESSNINNITYEQIKKIKVCEEAKYTESGIPLDEYKRIKIKKLLSNFSEQDKNNYNKVEEIINDIKSKNKNEFILNFIFCINCNQCFKADQNEKHTSHSFIQIENDNKDIDNELNNLDYNACLDKLYEDLKKDQKKILKIGEYNLIKYYGKLIFSLYEIITNNYSIEELNSSIIQIIDDYENEIKLEAFGQYFKDYFLYFSQRISIIAYLKKKKIEELLMDLEEENNDLETEAFEDEEDDKNNLENVKNKKEEDNSNLYDITTPKVSQKFDKFKINFENFTEEERKKYFLELGLKIKIKYAKNSSIAVLYSKAKEENIKPIDFGNYILKELNVNNSQN